MSFRDKGGETALHSPFGLLPSERWRKMARGGGSCTLQTPGVCVSIQKMMHIDWGGIVPVCIWFSQCYRWPSCDTGLSRLAGCSLWTTQQFHERSPDNRLPWLTDDNPRIPVPPARTLQYLGIAAMPAWNYICTVYRHMPGPRLVRPQSPHHCSVLAYSSVAPTNSFLVPGS